MIDQLLNYSSFIGKLIVNANTNVTGSEFLTFLLLIFLFFTALGSFRVPIELQGALLIPLLIGLAAYNAALAILLFIVIFVLAIIVSISWWILR